MVREHKRQIDYYVGLDPVYGHADDCPACVRIATAQEIKTAGDKAVDDEPEFPDEMPDEIWQAIILDKEGVTAAMRIAVKLTKQNIKERFDAIFSTYEVEP